MLSFVEITPKMIVVLHWEVLNGFYLFLILSSNQFYVLLQFSPHKKCAFPLRIKFLAEFVTFTEEIFNRNFICAAVS